MKLISMTAFVLEQEPKLDESYKVAENAIESIFKYANFLKKPLTLGMFVPTDEDGNVLEEPREDDHSFYTHNNKSVQEEYSEAKERVLFEGFELSDDKLYLEGIFYLNINDYKNIEDLMFFGAIDLTPYALKQIGL